MNNLKLKKARPVQLREIGYGEAWLQEQIAKDPSLLGLGDLRLIQREKSQPSGGRIDFLMHDDDEEIRFEIEVMLGAVDESHIIRTIEYWDVERQRYPTIEHQAVIVAEEITSRFFNVIRLLNRAIPMIAIQLSAFVLDDSIVLHFTRVLDRYEFGAGSEEEGASEQADRASWEKRTSRESLEIVDELVSLIPTSLGEAKVTYNRGHIALGTSGYQFCWLHPRKGSYWLLFLKVPAEGRAGLIEKLGALGIEAASCWQNALRFRLSGKDITEHRAALQELICLAEEWSRR
jgi:hypothetical protein